MKTTLALLAALLLLPGCSTQKNLTKLVKELAKDPASVNINLSTVYGTLRFERYIPGNTNVVVVVQPGQPTPFAPTQVFIPPATAPGPFIFYYLTNAPAK